MPLKTGAEIKTTKAEDKRQAHIARLERWRDLRILERMQSEKKEKKMDIAKAQRIHSGEALLDGDETQSELIMLMMGACLGDDGHVTCLECGRPNECCECDDGNEVDDTIPDELL